MNFRQVIILVVGLLLCGFWIGLGTPHFGRLDNSAGKSIAALSGEDFLTMNAALPDNEAERLAALREYQIGRNFARCPNWLPNGSGSSLN